MNLLDNDIIILGLIPVSLVPIDGLKEHQLGNRHHFPPMQLYPQSIRTGPQFSSPFLPGGTATVLGPVPVDGKQVNMQTGAQKAPYLLYQHNKQ